MGKKLARLKTAYNKVMALIRGKKMQRVNALFFVLVMLAGTITPLGPWVAQAAAEAREKESVSEKVKPLPVEKPKPDSWRTNEPVPVDAPSMDDKPKERSHQPERDHEDVSLRTATTKTWVNKDGTRSMEFSILPKHYLKDGKWEDVKQLHGPDKSYKSSLAIEGESVANRLNPLASDAQAVNAEAGDLKVAFQPYADGVKITLRDKTFTMKPAGARNVRPHVTETEGGKIVTYKEAWPGVDVDYEIVGTSLKETVILKRPGTQNSFVFSFDGTTVKENQTHKGTLALEGIPENDFFITPLTVNVNQRGLISEQVATQSTKGKIFAITVDADWLSKQPKESFPIAIDPSFENNVGGTYGLFKAYKSDGYMCTSSTCDPMTGGLNDNGWKTWRTMFRIPFDQLQGGNKRVLGASIHLVKAQRSYWTGYTGWQWVDTSWAPCFGFHCTHGPSYEHGNGANTNDWSNVRRSVAWMAGEDNPDPQWGGWMIMWSNENTTSWKQWEPNSLSMVVNYDNLTPQTGVVSPAKDQVVVTTQPTLKVSPVTDPDGDTVQYYYRVSTNPDAESGAVINSGWTSATQWTVPEGVLQDGTTYYWHVYTHGASQTNPNWVSSFKVDLRTGKDSTQAYDEAGPVSVDLATGNATTGTTTHSIAALGGNIGLSLDYNSPVRSVAGLKAEYWNNDSLSGAPVVTRVDPEINFAWTAGSPSGGAIPNDYFSARWQGYFVAPKTGTYQFGSDVDDGCRIWVNNQLLVDNWTWCGGQYGAGITLNQGQIVPIKMEYREIGGHATARLLVKGVVSTDGMVVPQNWLQTGVRPAENKYGLSGRYYTNDGSNTFPANESDPFRLLMARNDPKLSFVWGGGNPVPGNSDDRFLVRWRGYVIVPTSGNYTFGAHSDDGIRIRVGDPAGGPDRTALDYWINQAGTYWGNSSQAIYLNANQAVPITVEYLEAGGHASMNLLVRGPGYPDQEIPVSWLSPQANVLPDGWGMGLDPDGNVNYERLRASGTNVILYDSTGSTHEYTFKDGGYKPPVDEDGKLTRNADGTYTLVDTDGRTYIFDTLGQLVSLTVPQDDLKPAALKYEYAGNPSRLIKISDGVNNARNGTLHYGADGTNQCGTPSGFDAAPAGMLCAFKTTDGSATNFYYLQGRLARVERPGSEITDYGYDELGRVKSTRDPLVADAVAAAVRTDDASVRSEFAYDILGRVTNVTLPSPTAGANREQKTYEYTPVLNDIWTEPQAFSGDVPDGNPTLVNWGPSQLGLFGRKGSNANYREYKNGTWGDWQDIGGCMRDDPAPASWAPNRIDLFIRGCDDHVYSKILNNGSWNAYFAIGNSTTITSSPSVTSWAPGRYDMVARGPSGELMHRAYAGGWTPFGSLGGCISQAPTISTWGFDRLNIYVAGCENPSTFWQKYWAPGWTDYSLLRNERITSAPQSVSTPDKQIHVVARGSNGSLKYLHYNGWSWGDWQTLQSCIVGSPAVTQDNDVTVVVYKGCDGMLYQIRKVPTGNTKMHVVGDAEPAGYSDQVEYDNLFRTTKNYDKTGIFTATEWNPVKDLTYSTTDATGLKSTTIYDADDRPIDSYGPAPKEWFGSDRKPLATYVNQVPHTQTRYDEGIIGLSVAAYDNKKLLGAPKQHVTAFNNVPYASYGLHPNISGVVPTDGLSFRASGKVLLSQAGRYNFRVWHSDGARIYVDDKLIVDNWVDGGERFSPSGYHDNSVANTWVNIRVEVYKSGTTERAFAQLKMTPPGSGELDDIAANLRPAYNLTTSTKIFDSQTGDVETKTNYGSKPELGLAQSTVEDAGGLNLTTSMAYEPYQQTNPDGSNSYLRQTAKYLPGANTAVVSTATQYLHYKHDDSIDNPCTTAADAVLQAGMTKGKIEPDPDGAGPQTSRTTESVYDAAGRAVATRYNNDPWACTTYDARGRTLTTNVPAKGQWQPARAISNNYSVNGNPLITATTDNQGTITVEVDLLGRTVRYVDASGNVTLSTYDSQGHMTNRSGSLGAEEFTYDQYDRLVDQKLDGTTYAHVTYDALSRIDNVTYPAAGQQKVAYARDNLGRLNGLTYTGTQISSGATFNSTRALTNGWATEHIISAGGGNYDGTPNAQNTFTFTGLTAAYDSTKSTQFSASVDSGTQSGNTIQARVSYDFTGDGSWDRVETYNSFATDNVTGYQAYTQATGMKSATGTFADLQNGTVKVETWSATGTGQSGMMTPISTTTPQASTVTLPYGAGGSSTGVTIASDQVTRSVTGDVLSGTENGLAKSYIYDKAGRLTNATIGSSTYAYNFSAPTAAQCGQPNANLNAHKNSNRTSMTVNGATTTYCYDYADRLISSSDPNVGTPTYDDRGNMIEMGASGNRLRTPVDASDRSRGIEQYDSNGNGLAYYYDRDVQGRIIARYKNTIANWDWIDAGGSYYGFTGTGDTPDFVKDGSGTITEKYLQLPGNILLTIRPSQAGNAQKTYSLPNIHGDIFATTNASGVLLATHVTGPFGEKVAGQVAPNNTVAGATYGYVGQHEKLTETDFTVELVQMGARLYAPVLGRFTQVDPIEGGVDNNYVYPTDPVNDFDLDGTFSLKKFVKDNWKSIAVGAAIGIGCAATAGIGCAVAVGAAAGAAVAAGSYAYNHRKGGGSLGGLAKATGMGAISGAVSGAMGFGAGRVLGKAAFASKRLGVSSKLFGNARFGTNGPGKHNNYGKLKIGWSHKGTKEMGHAVFRIGFKALGKKRHINLLKGPRLW